MSLDRRTFLARAALVPTVLAGGCAASGDHIVIYSALPRSVTDRIRTGFAKATGIEARFWRASRNALIERAAVDATRADPGFDVLEMEAVYLRILASRIGAFASLPPNIAKLDGQKQFAVSRAHATCIGWNTQAVDPANAPRGYDDLLAPAFRHQIVVVENCVPWFFAMHRAWGDTKAEAFFDALARQGVRATQGHSLTAELVSSGEFAVSPTLYDYKLTTMKQAGDPVEFVMPEPLFVEHSAWSINPRSAKARDAQAFVAYVQSAIPPILRSQGISAGSSRDFRVAHNVTEIDPATSDGLEEPGMLAHWSSRLEDFLRRARQF